MASPPPDWPHRATSRHVTCGRQGWHVQEMGAGPQVLLLHGAGGASHSFRHLMPLLAGAARVIALDLPGQGFSRPADARRFGLAPMAEEIAALCAQEGWQPQAIIGHSAGAAIALQLALLQPPALRVVIGLNAALGGFEGVAGWLFPVLARLLARLPLVPQVFSRLAGTPRQVHQLIASTGSRLDAAGEAQYLHLLRDPAHVGATLGMMAQWNLDVLLRRLPQMMLPCLLITAAGDLAVPPAVSARAAALMPKARHLALPSGGHLVHEEAAAAVAAPILDFLRQTACDPTGALHDQADPSRPRR